PPCCYDDEVLIVATRRVLGWPRRATNLQFVAIVTLVLATEATVPHYAWAVRTGSGGTAPFSAVEAAVISFVWWPVFQKLTSASGVTGLLLLLAAVAATWVTVAAAGATAWCRVRPHRVLSPLAVLIVSLPACYAALALLRMLSPLTLPF